MPLNPHDIQVWKILLAPAQMRQLSLEGLGQGHMVEMVSLGPRRLRAHSSSLCGVITPASTHLLMSRGPTFMDKQVLTDLMSSLPTWLPGGVEISEDRTTGYEKNSTALGRAGSIFHWSLSSSLVGNLPFLFLFFSH